MKQMGGMVEKGNLQARSHQHQPFYVLNKTGLFSSTLSWHLLSLAALLVSSTTKTIVSVVTLNRLNKRKRNNTFVGFGESEEICNITYIQAPFSNLLFVFPHYNKGDSFQAFSFFFSSHYFLFLYPLTYQKKQK